MSYIETIRELVRPYIPPLWSTLDSMSEDIPEFCAGDLVEWTNFEDECEIGIGIIKHITKERFYDFEEGAYVELDCAYVVNANPDDAYGYYIPVTHMDYISLADYIAIVKEDRENATLQELQALRVYVATKIQVCGGQYGTCDMPFVPAQASPVSLQGGAA